MAGSKLAFVFPGQGSQSKGMLAELEQQNPIISSTFEEAQAVLGYDLWSLCQSDEDGQIDLTEITQPLLLTASVALWRLWLEKSNIRPDLMAGHSLGEWSALVCANVVDFQSALKLVRARGQFMQEAVPVGIGSMAAIIGLGDDEIRSCCDGAAQDQVVEPVNYNAPGQVVIAGHKDAVDRASKACKEAGAKRAMPLAVSAPFHCELMKPAADKLAEMIETVAFRCPEVPIIHNVNAKPESDPATIKQLMIKQIYHPVLWVECVQALSASHIIECGPGKVLNGMVKRIDRGIKGLSTDQVDSFSSALAELSGVN